MIVSREDFDQIVTSGVHRFEFPIDAHQRQTREFMDNGTPYIVGIRQGEQSGWVDTKDPFLYIVGEYHFVQTEATDPPIYCRKRMGAGSGYEYTCGQPIGNGGEQWRPFMMMVSDIERDIENKRWVISFVSVF